VNERWMSRAAVLVAVLTIAAGVIRASAGSRSDDLLLVHGWLQQWLSTGTNPYTSSPGVNYPPHAFVLLAPVGLIPRDIAPVVWAVLQAAMAPLTAWWLVREWPMTRIDRVIVVAFVTSWNSVMTGIWMGQFTLLATLCGLRALQQIDRPWTGGFWLCASTFKPHMGVIFVLWAIARGHWRTVAAGGLWGTLLLLVLAYSTQTHPITIVTTWLDVVAWMFGGSSPQRGITEWWGLLEPVLPTASVGLVRIAGSVAGVLVLAFALRRTRAVDRTGRIALAIIAIWSLATLFHRRYDLFLLAPAMAGLWVALRNDPATSRRHWVLWMGVHLALLVDVPWTWQVYYGPHAQPMGPLAWLCVHFDRLLVIGVGVWFWRRYRPVALPLQR
jgi:hypothetical protein